MQAIRPGLWQCRRLHKMQALMPKKQDKWKKADWTYPAEAWQMLWIYPEISPSQQPADSRFLSKPSVYVALDLTRYMPWDVSITWLDCVRIGTSQIAGHSQIAESGEIWRTSMSTSADQRYRSAPFKPWLPEWSCLLQHPWWEIQTDVLPYIFRIVERQVEPGAHTHFQHATMGSANQLFPQICHTQEISRCTTI